MHAGARVQVPEIEHMVGWNLLTATVSRRCLTATWSICAEAPVVNILVLSNIYPELGTFLTLPIVLTAADSLIVSPDDFRGCGSLQASGL